MERVAIYDRSCTGDVSITVERLKSFAEQNGLTVTEIYKDEKYSGLNENRPAYRKMLSDAGLGKYDILLIRGAVPQLFRNQLILCICIKTYLIFSCRFYSNHIFCARQKYEVVHKEEREQATKQFNTRLPSDEYEEIVAFLKKHGIPKVDLIRIGYGTLLENYKEIKQK